jgi:hypothetical protein
MTECGSGSVSENIIFNLGIFEQTIYETDKSSQFQFSLPTNNNKTLIEINNINPLKKFYFR